ncbi:NAC transcription factor 29-like protein [Carex littledalei]|uniref:NAC transcription factor 29-like protein n=1 Tax=Carex littledalei TaxID=544730 RepID=A0A833RDL6_9POAL|nr:NAC transcription factor 29-like protein [Carex littledalei]
MMDDDIRNWPCEENYITHLATRRKGDAIPQGVISVNPFSSNPWDFPEDSWYLFEENPNEEKWEGDVTRTENGFWKWSSTVTISTESTFGFRNVFEFYQGNTPVGTRTGWMMYQYHGRPNREQATHAQENISLCRLLWQNMERANSSRPNNSPSACADFCTSEPEMITIKEAREAGGNVLVNVSQDSFIELKDLMSSDGEISELYGFSDRDFLEFNDILISDTASTSSENSSDMSVNSEDYFNIGDMLRMIARDGPVSAEEEKDDCVSSFTGPVQYDQAVRDKLLKEKDSIPWDKKNSTPSHHLSNGSYLELRDLLPSNTASTKSGNLGSMRNNSCEYFNAHELLRDIARVDNAPVIGSESVAGHFENFVHPRNQADTVVPEEGPSTSANSRTGQVKRNLSDRSEGASRSSSSSGSSTSGSGNGTSRSNKSSSSKTPQSKRRKSVKKLAKIGKKLFCFS